MAHIFSLAAPETPSYTGGRKTSSNIQFPTTTPFFQGFNKPSRFEGSIQNLEVTGTIPSDIHGTFYRIQPDPRYPPLFEEDIHFSGDGSVSAFRFENGHVDFKQAYVQTERLQLEAAARKGLFGLYRNPFTDNEAVKGVIRTVSNTNIVFWRGMLLAMKEDGPPYALDPTTLETIGRYDFDGQVLSPTFTAHPKFDPRTGEMVCFAYEAGGDGHDASCDIVVYTIDQEGVKTEECWYKAPFCGMIHDCGLTENWLVLPLTPLKCDLERLKRGGNHFAWDPEEDQWFGIVPRRGGKPEDIVWLRADNGAHIRVIVKNTDNSPGFHGHVAGCYETPTGTIIFDLTTATDNVFFWFPPDNAPPPSDMSKRHKLISHTYRWEFHPRAAKTNPHPRVTPLEIFPLNGEFSRIDDRFVTQPYNHFWQVQIDPARPYDVEKCGPPAGGLFNCLGHFTWDEKVQDVYFASPTTTFQEPVFVPRLGGSGKEGDGYLMTLLNHLDVLRNDILIFDAMNLRQGPVAVVHLPFKLRLGLHGNFVEGREVLEWEERRREGGDVGPVQPAREPLPWQVKRRMNGNGEVNGRANGVQ